MMQLFPPICLSCEHYTKDSPLSFPTCKAFPEGIPKEIWSGQVDHLKPCMGEKLTFTPDLEQEGVVERVTERIRVKIYMRYGPDPIRSPEEADQFWESLEGKSLEELLARWPMP